MDTFTTALTSLLVGIAIAGSIATIVLKQCKQDNNIALQELENREEAIIYREHKLRLKVLKIEGVIK